MHSFFLPFKLSVSSVSPDINCCVILQQVSILHAWCAEHVQQPFRAAISKITASACGNALVELTTRPPQDTQLVSLPDSGLHGVYKVTRAGPACFRVDNCFSEGKHEDDTTLYDCQKHIKKAFCIADWRRVNFDFLMHVKLEHVLFPDPCEPNSSLGHSCVVGQSAQQWPNPPPGSCPGNTGYASVAPNNVLHEELNNSQRGMEPGSGDWHPAIAPMKQEQENRIESFPIGLGYGQPSFPGDRLQNVNQHGLMSQCVPNFMTLHEGGHRHAPSTDTIQRNHEVFQHRTPGGTSQVLCYELESELML